MLSQKLKLTRKERDLIRKVMDQLEFGLRVAGDTLSEEEIALVLKRAYDKDKLKLIVDLL
jgi:hypothetical protein